MSFLVGVAGNRSGKGEEKEVNLGKKAKKGSREREKKRDRGGVVRSLGNLSRPLFSYVPFLSCDPLSPSLSLSLVPV